MIFVVSSLNTIERSTSPLTSSTLAVKPLYAVTSPGHTDHGTERETYIEAEEAALSLATERGCAVWYEESPQSGKRTLVKSFRDLDLN